MTTCSSGPANLLVRPQGGEWLLAPWSSLAVGRPWVIAQGGRLMITTAEVVFEPHAFNLQHRPWHVPREAVRRATPRRWFFASVLTLELADGSEVEFVTANRSRIAELLVGAGA